MSGMAVLVAVIASLPGCLGAGLRHSNFAPEAMKLQLHGPMNGTVDINDMRITLFEHAVSILIYSITSCIGLAAAALLVLLIFDGIARWLHAARFHSCQKKVKRVHEVLVGRQGELSLCPYCVTSVSDQPSSMHVVFLCGHRFHMDCVNHWFREAPSESGHCPICSSGGGAKDQSEDGEIEATPTTQPLGELSKGSDDALPPATCKGCSKSSAHAIDKSCNPELEVGDSPDPLMNSSDEGKSFMLVRLHEQYPDIISKECVQRWCSCHTEIWLSELHCPRYNSLFNKHKWTRAK